MSHILLKLQELYGDQIRTRKNMENLSATLQSDNEYLFDLEGVNFISRSAADELYNMLHSDRKIALIHAEPFVQKMIDAVTMGRFFPRQRPTTSMPIIECPTIESLVRELAAQ